MSKEYGSYYASQLWDSPAAEYLLKERGLVHSTIQRFNLGYVGKPALGHGRYRGRVSIPYRTGFGNEIGIRYRRIDGVKENKYLATKGFNHLFAVTATENPVVFVTEGEIDAMVLWQLGYRAVGVSGANAWQDYYRYLFRNCEEVVICYDNDPETDEQTGRRKTNAGALGAAKVWRSLERTGIVTRAVTLPRGSDINDAYLELGEKGLRDLLEAA